MVSLFLLLSVASLILFLFFLFFNDTATTEIYTLSLHDALPISSSITPRLRTQKCWLRIVMPASHVAADRKSTRLNSSHTVISYAVVCLKKNSPPRFRPLQRLPASYPPEARPDRSAWFFLLIRPPPRSTLFPYTTLFR